MALYRLTLDNQNLPAVEIDPGKPLLKQLREATTQPLPDTIAIQTGGTQHRLSAEDTLETLNLDFESSLTLFAVAVPPPPPPGRRWLIPVLAVLALSLVAIPTFLIACSDGNCVPPSPTTTATPAQPNATPDPSSVAVGPSATAPVPAEATASATAGPPPTSTTESTQTPPPAIPAATVFKIIVAYPSGATWVDRGIGMQTAADMAKRDLQGGRLKYLSDYFAEQGIILEVELENDQANSAEAARIAEAASGDGQTRCIVGYFNSDASIAAADKFNQLGVSMLMLTPASTRIDVTQNGRNNIWRLVATDRYQAPEAYRLAADALSQNADGTGKILIVRRSGSDAFVDGVVNTFSTLGEPVATIISPTVSYERLPSALPDFSQTITDIQSISEPIGAFFFTGTAQELEIFLEQYGENYDKSIPIIGISAMDNINVISRLRDNGYNITYTGLAVPFLKPTNARDPLMAEWFVNQYGNNRSGDAPPANAAETYDGVFICARAIQQAIEAALENNEDPKQIQSADVAQAMKDLVYSGERFAVAEGGTSAGPYIFDAETRELKTSVLIVQANQGNTQFSCSENNSPPCRELGN